MKKGNKEISEVIGGEIQSIMVDILYKEWSSMEHLEYAITLFREAKAKGSWQGQVSFTKNEDGFIASAKIDGYLFKESQFIKIMAKRLAEL